MPYRPMVILPSDSPPCWRARRGDVQDEPARHAMRGFGQRGRGSQGRIARRAREKKKEDDGGVNTV